jgi:hypothetical protein
LVKTTLRGEMTSIYKWYLYQQQQDNAVVNKKHFGNTIKIHDVFLFS